MKFAMFINPCTYQKLVFRKVQVGITNHVVKSNESVECQSSVNTTNNKYFIVPRRAIARLALSK